MRCSRAQAQAGCAPAGQAAAGRAVVRLAHGLDGSRRRQWRRLDPAVTAGPGAAQIPCNAPAERIQGGAASPGCLQVL